MKWFSWRGSDTRSDFWICQLTLGVLVLVAAVFIEEQKAWTPIALIAIVLGFMSMARRFKDSPVPRGTGRYSRRRLCPLRQAISNRVVEKHHE